MNYIDNEGNLLAKMMLVSWTPICILLFTLLPARKAVIYSYMFGWLFLPMNMLAFPSLPDLNKATATNFGCLVGTLIFNSDAFGRYRFHWFDLPVLLYITSPIPSSIANQLGVWDGISVSLDYAALWGLPYFIGRIYFVEFGSLKDLLVAMFMGGLVYVPLCQWEIHMSPQLHRDFYGFHQHDFIQTIRGNSFRPMVFMQHGLMVGAWMGACTMIGYWLWRSNVVKTLWGYPIWYYLIPMAITFVMCKSAGAIILVLIGTAALYLCRWFRTGLPVLILCLVVPSYVLVRVSGLWDGANMVQLVETTVNRERAASLEYRLLNEELLMIHAREQWAFGWAGWGRAIPFREGSSDLKVVPDGLWIIILGQNGVWGVMWMIVGLTLPSVLFAIYCPRQVWNHPQVGPATIIAIVLMLYAIDMLPNAMMNPLYALAGGGLTALTWERLRFVAIRPGRPVNVKQVQVGRPMPLST